VVPVQLLHLPYDPLTQINAGNVREAILEQICRECGRAAPQDKHSLSSGLTEVQFQNRFDCV